MPKHPAQAAGERSAQRVKELEARVAELERLLRLASGYVETFGISGSAPMVYDRKALDEASDELLREIRAALSLTERTGDVPA